jgi:FkbM family methyltransferase
MVSYAENAEDVLLRRAFPGEHGYYVDIGAYHPTENSVTKHFYDKGWAGINIEPQRHFCQLLAAERPRDVNLEVAVGTQTGHVQLVTYPGLEALGTLSQEVVREHQRLDLTSVAVQVEVLRLESVLEQYVEQPIDFLKIDVEGKEADVLESFDLKRWRPRAFVIEGTFPGTARPTYAAWEHHLYAAGYVRTLFDGLNCFYARSDDERLIELLSVPANIFDQFVPYRLWRLLDANGKRVVTEYARAYCGE